MLVFTNIKAQYKKINKDFDKFMNHYYKYNIDRNISIDLKRTKKSYFRYRKISKINDYLFLSGALTTGVGLVLKNKTGDKMQNIGLFTLANTSMIGLIIYLNPPKVKTYNK